MRRVCVLSAVLLLCGVLAGAAAPGWAQEAPVTLTGTVTDEGGQPVAGATVRAEGEAERAALTGPDGTYRLGPIPAGSYVVRVEAIGYRPTSRTVRVTGPEETVDVVLETAPVALTPMQVVAAVRAGKTAASLPVKIDVINEDDIAVQRTLATNPTELLANEIPSFSPARQKLTSDGESFRGRRPLYLIDGVPQSNPLRDGRRDGFTIDTEVIERVEVVFGANAIQGLGATGGIINYITVSPPATGALEQRASFSATTADGFDEDGFSWRAAYLAAKRLGAVDVVGSVSVERRGLQYDGEGRPIAIDNVQGDVADSRSRNLFAKIGWEPDGGQRLQLTVNDFRLAQDGDFASVDGDRSLGMPAVSVPGDPEGVEPINDVTTLALDYEHGDILGGTVSAKAYYQDFSALYGGGRFGIFQDPAIAPVGELFDQSENNSEKMGARLTYAGTGVAGTPLDVVAGLDLLRDKTFQRLAQTDRNWVPVTKFFNAAPFVQLDLNAFDRLTLSGGLRWEIAALDVPDFTTIAGNREDYQPVAVAGGRPSFHEPLLNVGGVVTPFEGLRLYGTFSQAFTMPDVGRVLRGISVEGTAVEDFLDLEPIKTDNLEVGGTYGTARARLGLTYFESDAALGSRLVPNADGIFQVRRQPTRTTGWEITGRVDPLRRLSIRAGYSLLDGRFDGDGDGTLESDLGARDIGPNRLNVAVDVNRGGRVRGRLQTFHFFDRTFRDGEGAVTAEFDGYSTVDAALAADVANATITLSITNLFDEQYITYYGQAATTRNDRYFAGRGRTLTLRVEHRF